MTVGSWTAQAGNAPAAHAATVVTGGLDVSVDVGSITTAEQVGMNGSQETTIEASLTDRTVEASANADAGSGAFSWRLNPTASYPGDGTITLAGSYNCDSTVPTPGKIIIAVGRDSSGNTAASGSALVDITKCDGADQPFSVTITGSLTGGAYRSSGQINSQVIDSYNGLTIFAPTDAAFDALKAGTVSGLIRRTVTRSRAA